MVTDGCGFLSVPIGPITLFTEQSTFGPEVTGHIALHTATFLGC